MQTRETLRTTLRATLLDMARVAHMLEAPEVAEAAEHAIAVLYAVPPVPAEQIGRAMQTVYARLADLFDAGARKNDEPLRSKLRAQASLAKEDARTMDALLAGISLSVN
jgi:hypothetical protein